VPCHTHRHRHARRHIYTHAIDSLLFGVLLAYANHFHNAAAGLRAATGRGCWSADWRSSARRSCWTARWRPDLNIGFTMLYLGGHDPARVDRATGSRRGWRRWSRGWPLIRLPMARSGSDVGVDAGTIGISFNPWFATAAYMVPCRLQRLHGPHDQAPASASATG
jgi:hypothetical protein